MAKRFNPKSLKNLQTFKKGFDPNRNIKGAPKKLPILKELMAQLLGVAEGEDATKSELAKVAKAAIETAKNKKAFNQVAAMKEILDRSFGKVRDAEDNGDREIKINININRGTDGDKA